MDLKSATSSFKSVSQRTTAKVQGGTSLFLGTAQDSLLAVDGYGKSSLDVLSNMRDGIQDRIAKTKAWLEGSAVGSVFSGIKDNLAMAKKSIHDINAIKDQLTDSIGQTIDSVTGMTEDVLGEITSNLEAAKRFPQDMLQQGESSIRVNIGSAVSDLNHLIDLTNRLTLNFSDKELPRFGDSQSSWAIDKSILSNGAAVGATPIVDTIMEKYPNENNIKQVLATAFPDAIRGGNIDMIKCIIKWVGADYLLGKFPDAVGMILRGYRFPLGSVVNRYPELSEELFTLLGTIQPDWFVMKGTSSPARNLGVFRNASKDTIKLAEIHPTYRAPLKVALFYPTENVNTVARKMYPYMVF